jgi:dipeptidyl-peptidase 4
MNRIPAAAAVAVASLLWGPRVVAADALAATNVAPIDLARIHADPPLAGRLPQSAKLSPGGRYVSYLQPSAADSEVLELWAQALPAGAPRRLAAAAELIGARDVALTEAEKMALERRRVQQRGITGYEWCGERDERIVVPIAGDLYLIELDGERVRTQRLTFDDAQPERDPRCDAAGRQLGFVKGNDLWVLRLEGGEAKPPTQLTHSGSETLSTGLAEFIAAEEFDRFDGFWWSKDGRRLLALEVDEREVPVKTRMQIRAEGSELTQQRYPAAGETNAKVQALVIDADTGRAQRLPVPTGTEYLVRAGWFADGTPWLQALSRDQTELRLVDYPNADAAPRTLWVERDPAWVEVHSDLRELPSKRSGQSSLLWSSERSGKRQLWQIDRGQGGAAKQLTDLAEPVTKVVCAGADRVVFAAERERGRAQELFERDAKGRVRLLEPGPSRRWRSATADEGCKHLLVEQSAWGEPPRLHVLDVSGHAPAVAIQRDDADPLLARIVPEVRALDLLAADGVTPLNAFYLPPLAASSNAAGNAVIVDAYGGPYARTVTWSWQGSVPLFAHWQRLGFGVLLVDNRGMAGRSRDFSHAHHRAFGQVEVADLFAAVRQLPNQVKGIDPARIGLAGWSYGGFLAVRAMLDARTPFAAAVAGAPVVDWTLYDTAYTERFLGLPEGGNAAPYRHANLLLRASQLSKPLMLMHGTADDNVLFENTLRLIEALQAEGKLFETVIYPGQTHGVASRALKLHVDRSATDFFVRHLRP